MPVFATLKEMLALCWRERAIAFKFGLVPVTVNLILAVFVIDATPASFGSYAKNWLASVLSVLAFAPFCVAWYRMILFGKPDVGSWPAFTFTRLEFRFFGWTMLVSICVGLAAVIGILVGAALVIALSAASPVLGAIAGFGLGLAAVAYLLLLLSRWSMALAMAAADQPVNLKSAWDISAPYGWSMVGIQLVLLAALAVVIIIPLGSVLPAIVDAAAAKTSPPASAQLTLQLVGTIAGAVFLWLVSTMYAMVYRRIATATATLRAPGLDLSPTAPSQDHGAPSPPGP